MLTRTSDTSTRTLVLRVLLIVAWNLLALPATLDLAHSVGPISGDPLLPAFPETVWDLQWHFGPLLKDLLPFELMAVVLGWAAYRIATRRLAARPRLFVCLLWKACLLGTLLLPLALIAAAMWVDYAAVSLTSLSLAGLAVLPAVLARTGRHHRFPDGHCEGCGYDLTGNVSGRCPECGVVAIVPTSSEGGTGSR